MIEPELPTDPIESVEIEAVFSKAVQVIAWRELQDDEVWRQGWVRVGTMFAMLFHVMLVRLFSPHSMPPT